jgi:hypothetical protein
VAIQQLSSDVNINKPCPTNTEEQPHQQQKKNYYDMDWLLPHCDQSGSRAWWINCDDSDTPTIDAVRNAYKRENLKTQLDMLANQI